MQILRKKDSILKKKNHKWLYLVLMQILVATCRWNNQHGAINICKELGYTSGTWWKYCYSCSPHRRVPRYKEPHGTGPILAGHRTCNGGEANVWECPSLDSSCTWFSPPTCGTNGCGHSDDVGVRCTWGLRNSKCNSTSINKGRVTQLKDEHFDHSPLVQYLHKNFGPFEM